MRNILGKTLYPFVSRFRLYFGGQINSESGVGSWILHLASLDEVRTIVEIGSWNGRGSSACIKDGLRRRKFQNCSAIGIEVDPTLARKAKIYLKRVRGFQVLWGRIIDEFDLDSTNLTKLEQEWFNHDLIMIRKAPNVLFKLPDVINLYILDGGEFSSYAEFKLLKERVHGWIILDDTNTRKCRQILAEIRESQDFFIVWESSERNGVAVIRSACY
jgi:hypothetical protein